MDRDKKTKFVELAEKRVNRVLKDIKLLTNLSNRSNYDYTPAQVGKIVNAVDEEFKVMKTKFHQGVRENKRFKL